MKTYCVRYPGSANVYQFEARNEAMARRKAREFLEASRLPRGTEVWLFTEQAQRVVRESRQQMAAEYAKAGQIFD